MDEIESTSMREIQIHFNICHTFILTEKVGKYSEKGKEVEKSEETQNVDKKVEEVKKSEETQNVDKKVEEVEKREEPQNVDKKVERGIILIHYHIINLQEENGKESTENGMKKDVEKQLEVPKIFFTNEKGIKYFDKI
jgi:hypothetical protein